MKKILVVFMAVFLLGMVVSCKSDKSDENEKVQQINALGKMLEMLTKLESYTKTLKDNKDFLGPEEQIEVILNMSLTVKFLEKAHDSIKAGHQLEADRNIELTQICIDEIEKILREKNHPRPQNSAIMKKTTI